MKTATKNPFIVSVLIAGLGLILAGEATAQTFTTLYSFTANPYQTNSDGARPHAGLILSGGILYGTATDGGASGNGTVFALNAGGTGFTNLHSFSPGTDGAKPQAELGLSGNTLFGAAYQAGSSGLGTLFKVSADGSGFSTLYSFRGGSDGAYPFAGVVLSGNTLYGATYHGGSSGNDGTVFAINSDGTGFTNLHSFTGIDGAEPEADLVLSDNTLYGTAFFGGSSGNGTVFKVNTDGTGFANLHRFTASPYVTNSDGAFPSGSLVLSGNTLYGTTHSGGSWGNGTVFALNTDGTGFRNLHNFTGTSCGGCPNSDGASPHGGLILSGNTLYGTTYSGGSWGSGTVFALNTDGTGFRNLHSFTTALGPHPGPLPYKIGPYTNSDGANPVAGLSLSSNTLYGTALGGGSYGNGTVFSIFIQPQLIIIPSGANVILAWPTNYTGFTLQTATNLLSPVWTTNLPEPVVINGQNIVTNPISGTQQFFRLSQ